MASAGIFEKRRKSMVERLEDHGYLKGQFAVKAMLKVPREDFVPTEHRNGAYEDVPIPIPSDGTISAPHMHAIYISESGLRPGDKVLEVGAGSGILLAYAKEIVGQKGGVVGLEMSPELYLFAKKNLEKAGYEKKVKVVLTDGSLKVDKKFDKIFVSAASPDIPKCLVDSLLPNGCMLVPVGSQYGEQELVMVRKDKIGKAMMKNLGPVMFVPLRGESGF